MSYVVIGGGLAGLSAALTLQEAGESVELFEASDGVGGRVRSDYLDGYILDRGFQFINAGYSEIARLGVIPEIDFIQSGRTVDVVTAFGVTSIGDPRRHPLQALLSPLGTLSQKLSLLSFMGRKNLHGISLEAGLLASGAGDLYENLLKPFLKGVFLAEPSEVDCHYGREIIRTFLVGNSGLPRAGVGTLSEAIAARIENIHLNSPIRSLKEFDDRKIIVATDSATATRLLDQGSDIDFVDSHTWYHALPAGLVTSKNLRVTSAHSPLVNSIAISNLVSSYAPEDKTLISSTSISEISDSTALDEIAKFWGIAREEFELIRRYDVQAALPLFEPKKSGNANTARISDRIYHAGDYLTAGSQNGALLSGRLAAMESLAH
jgi:protoporphyrinogen oxidase